MPKIFEAIDKKTNKIVSTKEARNGDWYYKCIKCGDDMAYRIGPGRPHFYHRNNKFCGINEVSEFPESGEFSGSVAKMLGLSGSVKYSPDDDLWISKTKNLVEQSIDYFVKEFIDFPYLHRVEHSIHVQLYSIMMKHQELAQRVTLGDNLGVTQLVHKEWPIFTKSGDLRGYFDLAILSPKLLKECPSLEAFRKGHLQAPIVIEIGLDYNARHLSNDAKKLINSKPTQGYLIHLVREFPREPEAEKIVLDIEAESGIKIAYAWKAREQIAYKGVNDRTITEHRKEKR